MRSIPVDTSKLTLIAVSNGPKNDENKVQRSNNDGELLWSIQVLSFSSDDTEEDAEAARKETTEITIPGPKPVFQLYTPVELEGLVARAWAIGDRSGVSFSAKAVKNTSLKTTQKTPANGTVPAS